MIETRVAGIDMVISRFTRMQVGLPGAIQKVLEPGLWLGPARRQAEIALQGLAKNAQEQRMIKRFVESVETAVWDKDGLEISAGYLTELETVIAGEKERMTQTYPKPGGGEEVRMRRSPLGMSPGDAESWQRSHDLIVEWVQTEKRLRQEDYGKSPEEIASKIEYIIGMRQTFKRSGEMDSARDKLMPHLQDFIARFGEAVHYGEFEELDKATISKWLEAVLKTWHDMILRDLPLRIRQEIRKFLPKPGAIEQYELAGVVSTELNKGKRIMNKSGAAEFSFHGVLCSAKQAAEWRMDCERGTCPWCGTKRSKQYSGMNRHLRTCASRPQSSID